MSMNPQQLKNILEATLLAAGQPMSLDKLLAVFPEEAQPDAQTLVDALQSLSEDCAVRGIELKEVGSGFRFQVKQDYAQWVARLSEERAPRYSRALLETLVLIAYRQPISRAEIEDIRGVTVSTNIIRTLQEREWVRVVGHREVPGKPALYGTTRDFLDYFNLKSLSELPPLSEIRSLDAIAAEIDSLLPPIASEGEEGSESTELIRSDQSKQVDEVLPEKDAADQEIPAHNGVDEPDATHTVH